MITSAKILHTAEHGAQPLPRAGAEHRALVRHVVEVEGIIAADRGALEAFEQLAALIALLPLTDTARAYVDDRLYDVRTSLLRHLWPMAPPA